MPEITIVERELRNYVQDVQDRWDQWCSTQDVPIRCSLTIGYDGRLWHLTTYRPHASTSGRDLHRTLAAHKLHVLVCEQLCDSID